MADPITVIGAVAAVISAFISAVQLFEKSKYQSREVDILRICIAKGWEVLVILQTNETADSEKKAIQVLIKLCYDAEDLLEGVQLECRDTICGRIVQRLQRWLLNRKFSVEKIDNIEGHLEHTLSLCKQMAEPSHQSKTARGTTNVGIPTLFGRDDDVREITQIIVSPERLENNGISIQGMFGVGKSSLAQKIYNEGQIAEAFCRSWVDLTDGKFDLDNFKKKLDENTPSTSNGPKKFLIVIDNLQSVTSEEWHEFQRHKNDHPEKDIRIIITTQNPEIPTLTNTSPHKLDSLQDKYCGEVIKEYAKQYCKNLSGKRFESAVESVQEKCEGLPVVAKLYGINIGNWISQDLWDKVREAETSSSLLREVEKKILLELKSSIYKDLEPGLWRCCGYFSLFPHGHLFDIEDFVHLFIAECFIPFEPPAEPSSSLKKYIREDVPNDLKQKSIIVQPPKETLYKLHALGSHVVSAAFPAIYLRLDQDHGVSSEDLEKNPPRHLSILYKPEFLHQLKRLRNLRTFLSLHDEGNIGQLEGILPKLHKVVLNVRVLSLKRTNVEKLPESIDRLKRLRYLDISFTCVKQLPKGICSLHALQFLKLEGINLLDSNGKVTGSFFPPSFHELTNLLYVDWEENLLRKQPAAISKIGKLDRLENLPLFKVGRKEGYLISELNQMNNLQGSLYVQDLDEHVTITDATDANLQGKLGLTTIVLEWKQNSTGPANHYENILNALQFHEHMKEFGLKKYGGGQLPGWIKETFLQKIQLSNCRYCTFFSTLGKLQSLKILIIENMDSIDISCRSPDDTYTDIKQFPALETLELQNMCQLISLSGVQPSDMLCLQEVKIVSCGEMVTVSFLDHVENFKLLTIDDSQKLRELFRDNERRDRIPHIKIDGEELPPHNADSPPQTLINSSWTSMRSLIISKTHFVACKDPPNTELLESCQPNGHFRVGEGQDRSELVFPDQDDTKVTQPCLAPPIVEASLTDPAASQVPSTQNNFSSLPRWAMRKLSKAVTCCTRPATSEGC